MKVERIEDSTISYNITFNINQIIKGKVENKNIVIKTPCLLDACCGIPFEVKDEYVVYCYFENGHLYTDLCTLTQKLNRKVSLR